LRGSHTLSKQGQARKEWLQGPLYIELTALVVYIHQEIWINLMLVLVHPSEYACGFSKSFDRTARTINKVNEPIVLFFVKHAHGPSLPSVVLCSCVTGEKPGIYPFYFFLHAPHDGHFTHPA
jgi:hypothetical protein